MAPRPAPATPLADGYRDVAAQILAHARADGYDAAWRKLAHLADRIGARPAGSKALERAVAWAAQAMKDDGHDVRLEEVKVPHWVRGAERARMVAPFTEELAMLGLGGTVATGKKGVTAPVMVVTSFEDLEARAAEAKGKIVLYDVEMPAWNPVDEHGYGKVALYRWRGASAAAKHGAVGVMIRSLTARSLRTAHTGSLGYDDKLPKVPAVAISTEDTERIRRLIDAGDEVKVELVTSGKWLPDATSHNVIGELRGREAPDEVVVLAAHLDSWDVGQGAHDDGGGCAAVMQALTALRELGLQPRRTIRVVLYTNEEHGLSGAAAYAAAHTEALGQHVAAIELDMGIFAPLGVDVDAGAGWSRQPTDAELARQAARVADMADVLSLLAPLGATRARAGHGGADITPLAEAGVPALGFAMDTSTYFDYHHTEADTLDKVDPVHLRDVTAAVAVLAYVLADLPGRVGAAADVDPAGAGGGAGAGAGASGS